MNKLIMLLILSFVFPPVAHPKMCDLSFMSPKKLKDWVKKTPIPEVGRAPQGSIMAEWLDSKGFLAQAKRNRTSMKANSPEFQMIKEIYKQNAEKLLLKSKQTLIETPLNTLESEMEEINKIRKYNTPFSKWMKAELNAQQVPINKLPRDTNLLEFHYWMQHRYTAATGKLPQDKNAIVSGLVAAKKWVITFLVGSVLSSITMKLVWEATDPYIKPIGDFLKKTSYAYLPWQDQLSMLLGGSQGTGSSDEIKITRNILDRIEFTDDGKINREFVELYWRETKNGYSGLFVGLEGVLENTRRVARAHYNSLDQLMTVKASYASTQDLLIKDLETKISVLSQSEKESQDLEDLRFELTQNKIAMASNLIAWGLFLESYPEVGLDYQAVQGLRARSEDYKYSYYCKKYVDDMKYYVLLKKAQVEALGEK